MPIINRNKYCASRPNYKLVLCKNGGTLALGKKKILSTIKKILKIKKYIKFCFMLEKISSIIISIRSVFYKYLKMILFLMHHKLRSIFNLICFWTKRGNKQLYCFYVLNKSFSLNLDSNLICKWIKLFVTASVSA